MNKMESPYKEIINASDIPARKQITRENINGVLIRQKTKYTNMVICDYCNVYNFGSIIQIECRKMKKGKISDLVALNTLYIGTTEITFYYNSEHIANDIESE